MKRNAPRHGKNRSSAQAPRRDRDFREELAQAWEVEETPASFRDALEETFAKLPPEPIVRSRPLYGFLRGLGAAAAACAAAFLILMGLNLTKPSLTESLPGLGPAFQAFNRGLQEKPPQPEASVPPVSTLPEESELSQAQDFSALPVEDNGIWLTSLSGWKDGALTIRTRVPYMGRMGGGLFNWSDAELLGCWPILTLEDGTTVSALNDLSSNDFQDEYGRLRSGGEYPSRDSRIVNFTFPGVDLSQAGQVTVTFYESLFWLDPGAYVEKLGLDPINGQEYLGKRVTAEFTLDLSAGKAKATEKYRQAGLRKITPEECLDSSCVTARHGFIAGDLYAVDTYRWMSTPVDYNVWIKAEVVTEDTDSRPLMLNCMVNGERIALGTNFSPDSSGNDVLFLDEIIAGSPWYMGSFGKNLCCWYETPLFDNQDVVHTRIVFAVPAVVLGAEDTVESAQALLKSDTCTFQLADANNGEVIIGNLAETHQAQGREMLEKWAQLCGPAGGASPLPASFENQGESSVGGSGLGG